MKKFNKGINYYMLHSSEVLIQIKNDNTFLVEKAKSNKTIEYLSENKIIPYGAHVLSLINDDEKKWSTIHKSYEKRNLIILEETRKIFKRFSDRLHTIFLFENFGTILSIDACLACFSSGDIDLSANPKDYDEIEKCMLELGYVKEIRRGVPDSIMTTFSKQKVLENKDFYVNFEWKPIARRYIKNMINIHNRLEQFRKKNIKVLDNGIKVLSNEALLYFNLLHVSIGHYYNTSPGIRLYADVDRLIRHAKDIDYNKIFTWAEEDKQSIRIFTTLKLAEEILNTPIQDCSQFVTKQTIKYSSKITRYLWDVSSNSYINKTSILNQWKIDSMSEGMNLVKYACLRLIKLNRVKI